MAKFGALLLAFGGADSIDSVEPFVRNVLKGRPVTPELVEKTKDRYRIIGGKSPLLDITKAQAAAVDDVLKRDGYDFSFYIGMRYWNPFIKEAIARMKEDGVDRAIAIIMAPFISRVATGGYVEDVESALSAQGGVPRIEYATSWHLQPLFIEAVAEKIGRELKAFEKREDVLVIFSNHSLPMTALEGDPYEMMIHQSVGELLKKTGGLDYKVAYQSKGAGPREWKGPSTEETIEAAARSGKKGVIIVPLGFAADHVETLYDIDVIFKGIAESNGLVFSRTESLNTTQGFIDMLASIIKRYGDKERVI